VGDRGMNPTGLEVDFGVSGNRESLIEHSLRETFVLAQLESPEAIRNAESIAAVEGLDGLFLGPSDLTIRMQHESPDLQMTYEDTMTHVAAACQQYGKIWGTTAQTVEDLRDLRRRRADFLMWGTDIHILRAGLTLASQDIDDVLKE
jgi:4-hydroxy-2-oxoheptanedioate aldolase